MEVMGTSGWAIRTVIVGKHITEGPSSSPQNKIATVVMSALQTRSGSATIRRDLPRVA